MDAKYYRDLIQAFLDGGLSVQELKSQYFTAFKNEPAGPASENEPGGRGHQLFLILEDFFEDLDAYSPLWTQEEETPFRITEPTLRQEAAKALIELNKYLNQSS